MKKRLLVLLVLFGMFLSAPQVAAQDPSTGEGWLELALQLTQISGVHVQVVHSAGDPLPESGVVSEDHNFGYTTVVYRFRPTADNRLQGSITATIEALQQSGAGDTSRFIFNPGKNNYVYTQATLWHEYSRFLTESEIESIGQEVGLVELRVRQPGESADTGKWYPPLDRPIYKFALPEGETQETQEGFDLSKGWAPWVESVEVVPVEGIAQGVTIVTPEPNQGFNLQPILIPNEGFALLPPGIWILMIGIGLVLIFFVAIRLRQS